MLHFYHIRCHYLVKDGSASKTALLQQLGKLLVLSSNQLRRRCTILRVSDQYHRIQQLESVETSSASSTMGGTRSHIMGGPGDAGEPNMSLPGGVGCLSGGSLNSGAAEDGRRRRRALNRRSPGNPGEQTVPYTCRYILTTR